MLVNFRVQIRLGSIYLIDGGLLKTSFPLEVKVLPAGYCFLGEFRNRFHLVGISRAEDNIHALQFTSIQNVLDGRSIVMGIV